MGMRTRNGHGRRALAAIAVAMLLGLAGCGSGGDDQGAAKDGKQRGAVSVPVVNIAPGTNAADAQDPGGKPVDQVNWGLGADIVKFDPAFAYDYQSTPVVAQSCEGLLRFDYADGAKLVPNLAESYDSPDPKTYIFKIRSGVKFHDGSELTAEDVKFSLDRTRDPKVGAYASGFLSSVKSVEITAPDEVTVKLTAPDRTFLYGMAMTASGAIVSKDFVTKNGDAVGGPKVGMDCTGPFKFDHWTRGQEVRLVRFDDYWNTERTPKVAKLTFKILGDESTLVAALGTGEIDGTVYGLDGRMAKGLRGPVKLVASPSSNVAGIMFNTQRKPWSDPRVRQGLAYALDRAAIRQSVFNGFGDLTKSVAPPVLWSYEKDAFKTAYDALPAYDLDVAKGKQLVSDAGATGATGKLMMGSPTDRQVGLIVQQAAESVGLKLKLEQVPFDKKTAIEYNDGPKDYDLTLLTWLSDVPDPIGMLYYPFDPTSPITNISAYKNATVAKELKQARSAGSPEEASQHLIAAQKQMMEDVPWIPYIATDTVVPVNDRLTGWQPSFFSYWNSWGADLSGT
jgi:peptide/nickel transport system substrate-binding protein